MMQTLPAAKARSTSGWLHAAWNRGIREWQSVLTVAAAAALAGYMLYAPMEVLLNGWPIQYYTAAIYGSVTGVAAMATFSLFPGLGDMTCAVAFSRLMVAICVYSFPETGQVIVGAPLANASIVIGGAIAICWVRSNCLQFCRSDLGVSARGGVRQI